MRILLVCQYYYPERFSVNDIAETLVSLGNQVTVVTGKPNYGFKRVLPEYKKCKYEYRNGVEIFHVKVCARKEGRLSISANYLSFYKNAKRFMRSFKQDFDVVLSISLSPVISIAPAIVYAKKHNVPHVLFCEDLWPESTVVTNAVKRDSIIYNLLYKWSKSLYQKCDDIIVSSPSFKEYFNDVLNISDKSFEYINQPIIKSQATSIKPVKYENGTNLVYAGNIGTIQLIDKLVDSLRLLKDKNVKLHLMGMGSELESIKEKIIQEGLSDQVFYHGALPIEQAEAYYVNADALIVSLKNERYVGRTIPNKAIQYLKYGRPILGVISGDAKELLEKANGTIFAEENTESIAEAIEKISNLSISDKKQLGINNSKYFEENLTEKILVKEIEKVLERNINNKRSS